MMTQKQFRLSAVAAALAAVFGAAMADEAEIDALIQPDSSVSVGVGNWSGDDRRQTGIYDAMQKNGNYGSVDADVNKRNNDTGTWFKLKARNVGLENGEIKGEYLKQGDIGVGLEYNQITRDDPNAFMTNLKGIGTTRLIQNNAYGTTGGGAGTDYANKTGRFAPQTTLLDNLGTKREQTGLSLFKNLEGLFPGLEFNVNFKNEDKTGTRNWSRGGSQSAFFAVEPIDSTTRQLDAALSYTTPKFQVRGGYNGSWYQNNTSKLMVIGQPGLEHTVANNSTTFLSLPLDNEAHQLFLNGGYNFTKDTRGTFKLEYARATQNDHNPSTDITTANGYTANLSNMNPPGSLNAKVNTTLAQFGLTSRVTKDFSVNANLRYHNKDDQTPIVNYIGNEVGYPVYPYVRSSYKTLSGKVEGTYRLSDGYSVVAGLEQRQQDRREPVLANGTEKEGVVPFRHKLDETTSRLEVRRAMTETVNGSVSWVNAKRDGSSYSLMERDTFVYNGVTYDMGNKINPISVADRNRDKIRLVMDWNPTDVLSLQFVAEGGQDKYSGENAFGLKKGTTQLYSVDAAWALSEKFSVNAWYSYDQTKAEQTGFLTAVAGTRRYELTDSAESVGLGVKWEATPRLRTGANLQWTKSIGRYETAAWNNAGVQYATTTGDPGTITPSVVGTTNLPKITNKYLRVSLFSLYALDKSSDVRFDVVQDYWKTNDWTWQFADGSPLIMNDGTTAVLSPKQSATFVGARYIYKFQ